MNVTANMLRLISVLLIFTVCLRPSSTQQLVFVSFVDTILEVEELPDQQVAIKVLQSGYTVDSVTAVISILYQIGPDDFMSSTGSWAVTFPPNILNPVVTATITILDDDIPETDELFILQLSIVTPSDQTPLAQVGTPAQAQLTIKANDDAFGIIQFASLTPIVVNEAVDSNTNVHVMVRRNRGLHGNVTVYYEVINGPNPAEDDITPSQGTVTITDQNDVSLFTLEIIAEEVPENDETFVIRLSSVTGGATINDQADSIQLTVLANDSPIRFAQAEYYVEETVNQVTLEVYRGLSADGSSLLGPDTGDVTVQYTVNPNTAVFGQDYTVAPLSGFLGFRDGDHNVQFSINIVNDALPEIQEEFYVSLSQQSLSAVIADPGVARIIILPNDDPNGALTLTSTVLGQIPSTILNEDTQATSDFFVVERLGGNFGEVSIAYLIERNDSNTDPVEADLYPASGVVTLADGVRSTPIIIMLLQDSEPEPAEKYTIEILPETVTGGAKVEGVITGSFIIQDSDDIYGVVQFSSDTEQKILTSTSPRKLQLTLTRAISLDGDVLVNFVAVYNLPVDAEPSDQDVLLLPDPMSTVFPADTSTHRLEILIVDDAFLHIGAEFQIQLTSAVLLGVETIIPTVSPRLGDKNMVLLTVTNDFANGEIGFNEANLQRVVNEPPGFVPLEVVLPLSREGISGDATVYWHSTGTPQDIEPLNGTVYFPAGVSSASLSVHVVVDDIPETDETVIITLDNIEPSSQRLRSGFETAEITILENDNPGGVFEFSSVTSGPYTVQEAGQPIQISVVRTGGNLVERSVMYWVVNGADEFLGVPEVLVFQPGESVKNFTLVAAPDGVPELEEMFQLKLSSHGTPASNVGGHNSITIFVEVNDDPNGVFQFVENPMIRNLDESKDSTIQTATFAVVRAMGNFYEANVSWELTPIGGQFDVLPTSGVLHYADGQNMNVIELTALDDEVPEQPETFNITLSNPTGGARLGHPIIATLNINNNDDPIFFEEPIDIIVSEPGTAVFTVKRNGTAASFATVKYRTISGTAQGSQDYPNIIGYLEFPIGITTQTFSINIYEDDIPETDEQFTVELYEPIGDIVVYGAPIATVTIEANDDPNGIFSFEPPLLLSAPTEGINVDFMIQRERGMFGVVQVYWQVYYNNTGFAIPDGLEFTRTSGLVEFANLQTKKELSLEVAADGIPEFQEVFSVKLVYISGGPPGPGGELSTTGDLEVILVVEENDDPYGLFIFPSGSKERHVAEDYYQGHEYSTHTLFILQRNKGATGMAQVLWELFTDATSGTMPSLKDLIFLSSYETGYSVEEMPDKRRPHTGTMVLSFNGSTDAYLTVAPEYQPDPVDIMTGFAISVWIQPTSECNGFIVAKATSDAAKTFYGLKLSSLPFTSLEFRYASHISSSNHVVSISIPNMRLDDGDWHLVILNVNNGMAEIYIDGEPVAPMYLVTQQTEDGEGILWVGSHPPGTSPYQGLLQDLRIYSRKLELNEISELWEYPSKEDVTPISGYLTYQPGVQQQFIEIQSIQDIEEEGNEVFTLNLLSVKGGARRSPTESTALLTVLKSDNANGLFSFDGPCSSMQIDATSTEAMVFTCDVVRNRGDEGTVALPWEVHQLIGGFPLAIEDFINATGTLTFPNGIRTGTITLEASDDVLPEFEEHFQVVLVSQHPMSDDGVTGSTNTSGASIDPTADTNDLFIPVSDSPHGLLQFSNGSPPAFNDPLIMPATSLIQRRVSESIGTVSLLIVRAQGLSGEITAEWRTFDRTAVSAGKSPIDFVSRGGVLTFADQQRYAYVDIQIIDNSIPELDKMFEVQLSNPGGGASIAIGSTIQVIIENSDNAYGVFQFADNSLSTVVAEEIIGYSTASLEVIRAGGALGEVVLDWSAEEHPLSTGLNATDDLLTTNGQVTFAVNQYSANIEIQILTDTIPELDEVFIVILKNPSNGKLGEASNLVATVTVAANDDPFGSFVFSSTSRPVVSQEGNVQVTLQIIREFGIMGAVRVDYATLNYVETLPNMPPFIRRAKEFEDFIPIQGSVIFMDGQTEVNITIDLLDDNIPEEQESVFVYITDVNLISNPQSSPVERSPRIGSDSIGQIQIVANDNANGVLQLSESTVVVTEDHIGPFINVTRTAGSFGMVTVRFQAIAMTAQASIDYSVSSSDVILLNGETYKAIPVEIVNDGIPEVEETFEIRLLDQIFGGASLGSPTSAVITILPSDDPNGRFDFAFSNTLVEEPNEGQTRAINITVVRGGGSSGVVAVEWQATYNGRLATTDVLPTGGVLYFLSTMTHETFRLEILPDDVPEEREEIQLKLLSASNGGMVGPQSEATIVIEANDDPHGVIQFANSQYVVLEEEGNTVANIRVNRSRGTFGDLEVFYSTKETSLMMSATAGSDTVLDYYHSPLEGSIMGQPKNYIDVSQMSFPLGECAGRCLQEKACASFEFKDDVNTDVECWWSLSADSTSFDASTGFSYYVKDMNKVQPLYDGQAAAGVDFAPVNSGSIQISDGASFGYVTVVVLNDSIPELDESFQVKLESVRLLDLVPLPQNQPQLGQQTEAEVIIGSNDDANGVWTIYSNSPDATENGQSIAVEERDGLSVSVELVIERTGGAIGDVSISWRVAGGTASNRLDYTADGATLTFPPRERRQEITLSIRDDVIPEVNETLIVELFNPGGGSILGRRDYVTVTILANDYVAGVLKFTVLSYIVKEGDRFEVTVERSPPAVGTVEVSWKIEGVNNHLPQLNFQDINGTLVFAEGQSIQVISIYTLVDDTPETNEEYVIKLHDPITEGVPQTGAAGLDTQGSTASITIEASDEPYGIFVFTPGSVELKTDEADKVEELIVERKFGSIGYVRIFYEIRAGSINPLTPYDNIASSNTDFIPHTGYIDFTDGIVNQPIQVQILEDTIPELDEVFLVNLTSVMLMSTPTTDTPPKLGPADTLAQVTIRANDGTQGVVQFANTSASVTVTERSMNVTLIVERIQGTYGTVTVFCYTQPLEADRQLDYIFTDQVLTFTDGESMKIIVMEILEDDIPEDDETFEVILDNVNYGLELGTPRKATVTILANDDAFGVVSFASFVNVTIYEPTETSTADSVARFTVVRDRGAFREIQVPFLVTNIDGGQAVVDVTPVEGFITFEADIDTTVLEISAVLDNEPELDESFMVTLLEPTGGSQLGFPNTGYIQVADNDAPFGLMQIYPLAIPGGSSVNVEENTNVAYFTVYRARGTLGAVTVNWMTSSGSAKAIVGTDMTELSVVQTLSGRGIRSWHSFDIGMDQYLVLVNGGRMGVLTTVVGSDGSDSDNMTSNANSLLYKWQGEYIPVQTIETDGAVQATSTVIGGYMFLAIANHGGPGRYSTSSRIYRVGADGTLNVFQDIPTEGASDVVFFKIASTTYLVIANEMNNNEQTTISSQVFVWSGSQFVQSQLLSTTGAVSLTAFTIDGEVYIAMASRYDSSQASLEIDSVIYKWNSNRLEEYQRISTQGATDVDAFTVGLDTYIVFANSKANDGSTDIDSEVLKWDTNTRKFISHQRLSTNEAQSVHPYDVDGTQYLTVSNALGESTIYVWRTSQFVALVTGPPAYDVYPVTVSKDLDEDMVLLALANFGDGFSFLTSHIYTVAMLGEGSDYAPRSGLLSFGPGENQRMVAVSILDDEIPEDTEDFYVSLNNPTGGAEISNQNQVLVNILSNDNAHGVIAFADNSLDIQIEELSSDNAVVFTVNRLYGTSGLVVVEWQATGDHSSNDISPTSGQIEFPDGIATAAIYINVLADITPELDEVSYIQLTQVITAGTVLPGRGAIISRTQDTGRLTVLANDSPHGVVAWDYDSLSKSIDEPIQDGSSATVTLNMVREQGSEGSIIITYSTSIDVTVPDQQQAKPGEDFVDRQDTVSMADGANEATVFITVRADRFPEGPEVFLVNITSVSLLMGTPIDGAAPSVKMGQHVAQITINENDYARGILQFDVDENDSGEVEVYEGGGTNGLIQLTVSRTEGAFTTVQVSWQAYIGSATSADFAPLDGTISFLDGQREATVDITIIDDDEYELDETFNVRLYNPTNGAVLGSKQLVAVKIKKNDSPFGLFGFTSTQESVMESENNNDPNGQVTFVVQRTQFDSGTVFVQWKLEDEASSDLSPLQGTLTFAPGVTQQSLTLRTLPDNILEGEERFSLDIISVSNDADISPVYGHATVVILPNQGAAGIVSVLPQYRNILISEPTISFDGSAQIYLTRGIGNFGMITVNWQLSPRDESTFDLTSGTVVFEDQQRNASISLQTKDDSIPELKQTYRLQLVSINGGASIDITPGANEAVVTMVASDNPHGIFEFDRQQMTVSEDDRQILLQIVRNAGLIGQVQLSYTTSPGTAITGQDFSPSSRTVIFSDGVDIQNVDIIILQDDIPEAPEDFYVNITSLELLSYSDNDYSDHGGLALDMPPIIGPTSVVTIVIDKNDNAEGIIEFSEDDVNFVVTEDIGTASVPVTRIGGMYGLVSVKFTSQPLTATPNGVDYVLNDGEVVFQDGQSVAYINVDIIDDNIKEFAEMFEITLTDTLGGATLGSSHVATVTISKSDGPDGLVGFTLTDLDRTITNPDYPRQVTFTIQRTGGLDQYLAQAEVKWRILGPNTDIVLDTTEDIATPAGQLQGSVSFFNGERGSRTFTLIAKPYPGPEQQEIFTVEIYQIIGAGELSTTADKAVLTIMKHGDPNGVVMFAGEALQPRNFDEPNNAAGPMTVSYPIRRREGVIGDINVNWEIKSLNDEPVASDCDPSSGIVLIPNAEANSQIYFTLLPDDIPEIKEEFQVVLVSSDGGAEIDPAVNVSTFYILANDDPHGVFSVRSEDQTVVVKSDLSRFVSINVTRSAGTTGDVRVVFSLEYDSAEPGRQYIPSTGAVTCVEGEANCIEEVPLTSNDAFLSTGSSFTVTITDITYLSSNPTIDPRIDMTSASATFEVPDEAANSLVGFNEETMQVDDETNEVILTVERIGSYGNVNFQWQRGYPDGDLPNGFVEGDIFPSMGSAELLHGQSLKAVAVQLYPSDSATELFAVHITSVTTTANGGALLRDGYNVAQIDTYGVVGFDEASIQQSVVESDTQVSITIVRRIGCYGNIQVRYQTIDGTAQGGSDYTVVDWIIQMNQLERTRTVHIPIKADDVNHPEPEVEEYFYVKVTEVRRLPSSGPQGLSPRISTSLFSSTITIDASNDPYGVFAIDSAPIEVTESNDAGASKVVQIPVHRYFGAFGTVTVHVRTVGGGETGVTPESSNDSDTISGAMYSVMDVPHATQGEDYEPLDTTITFVEGSVDSKIDLVILDDDIREPAEVFFVYLSDASEGARIADGDVDPNDPEQKQLRGYVKLTIAGSDYHNGIIGFTDESLTVSVSEDDDPAVNLILDRGDAYFDQVTVSWQATYSDPSSSDADLYEQLDEVSGETVCNAGEQLCPLLIMLQQDDVPEFESQFSVILTQVGEGATIDTTRNMASVTMLPSDYPYGLVQFSVGSRLTNVDQKAELVGLTVERVGGSTQPVSVSWSSREIYSTEKIAGVVVFPAVEGQDFKDSTGTINLDVGDRRASIDIVLTPDTASSDHLPKMFQVVLLSPTNGASLSETGYYSNITIVQDKTTADVWDTWASAITGDLTDSEIDRILREISATVAGEMTDDQLAVVQDTLDLINEEGAMRQLPLTIQDDIMDIFCDMLNPDRSDTLGESSLAQTFVNFVYTLLTEEDCEMEGPRTLSCDYAYVEAARWLPVSINGHQFRGSQRDLFQLPSDLLVSDLNNEDCEDIHFIEYSSSLWFDASDKQPILNQKVLSVGLKDRENDFTNLPTPVEYRIYTDDSRVTPQGADCLLWNVAAQRWFDDECSVLSDVNDYVDCSCNHLSNYAARGETDNLTGYNEYIYASCFICMMGLALAILAHHICSLETMFAAKLLMHMCFACISLQIVFVINAYVSNRISASGCSAIATVMHYFFLAQFSWMFVQAINLWKVLVMNDEHTERYYVLFFMLGWGVPAVLVVIYVVVLYAAFGWPYMLDPADINPYNPEVIYGDVHQNGDICFIPNAYASLAGVIAPTFMFLFFVAVVFMQAYQVTPQWKQYDDVYVGRYNTAEVRILLFFWFIIFMTWIWGGLHMALGELWALILFCIFNIIQGLYAFIVYTILRNQLCRPAKGQYSLNNTIAESVQMENQNYTHSRSVTSTVEKGSKGTLGVVPVPLTVPNTEINNWEKASGTHSRHSDIYAGKQPSSHTSNIYAPMPYANNLAPQDEPDSQEFDDLIFALKTGTTYSPSEDDGLSERARSSHLGDVTDGTRSTEQLVQDMSGDADDHYELRRISIADTHL
uniref:G protein coupled receptor 98-like protein isoform X1 n=2 Tax=Saccoglossus kowalevskii TaxID=10224 RepID=A0ABM0LXD1_SACKO|nr:PREDICTED: G protein coupled receptor 98-like protein isoform X1 [Saccoglossus kowalevskii]